jgi:16S rRNA (guanine966-N2)-methyltransferase
VPRKHSGRRPAASAQGQKGQVRIIGGERRGHRLHFVDHGGDLRPSSDRMRETLFNWLQFEIPGLRVLDLFAGSGALGAEALSRGACEAVLVEKQRERSADLRRQLTPLFEGRLTVQCADALSWLPTQRQPFDLVFIDPPYDLGLVSPTCEALEAHGLLADGAIIYVESRRKGEVPAVPANWQLTKEKSSGDIHARLYRRQSESG